MKFTTLLPRKYNNGKLVRAATRAKILDRASDLFGGYTLENPVQGGWRDESGRFWADESYRLVVACDRKQYQDAVEFVLWAGELLEQDAMYFEVQYFDGVQILPIPKRK
jgi:hypothetical protein